MLVTLTKCSFYIECSGTLAIMPNWYFSKEDLLRTPSRLDGIDYMTEIRYRREGTRFIMNCGNRMRLYPFTSTAATLAFCRGFLCAPSRLR